MHVTVSSTQILVVAPGDSQAARNNAKGHLFEKFVARLAAIFGYEEPTTESLNNTSSGIELDVRARHQMTKHTMIAECKAYSSPLSAKDLSAFYGKLVGERFDDGTIFGYFVAIPGLTAEGRERQTKLEEGDKSFRVLNADAIVSLLGDAKIVQPLRSIVSSFGLSFDDFSDTAIVIAKEGLFYASHQLAPDTRMPMRVLVFPSNIGETVPPAVVELLSSLAAYTRDAPCVAPALGGSFRLPAPAAIDDAVFEVAGSSSDFEYQFPAAPRFFVGRETYIAEAEKVFDQFATSGSRAEVVVLNAQSGWGKSSLSLRLIEAARKRGGGGVCIDCRTASQSTFVATAIRYALLKAQAAQLLTMPSDASFASIGSVLDTLRACTPRSRHPFCIFFDQFENVFTNATLTKEFRDLALGMSDVGFPLLLGFGWKTDVVSFTEHYPYQLRDDIRSRARVFSLTPFGPSEIGQLLTRLQKQCGQKIHPYVRERMREYSQGLPWLFKKLASHIIRELQDGTTQDQLLAEVLSVQSLFESDMSGLNLAERTALKAIARRVPLAVTEAFELAGGATDVVQSLLSQRLLVSIGEKLDVYWDVFRDYLNNGTVPLQESYVLRLTPNSVSKLLAVVSAAGGSTTPAEAAKTLGTSVISVLNMARDLRQLGILAAQEGVLRFGDDLVASPSLAAAIRGKAATVLKRHRVFSLLTSLAAGGSVAADKFAEALPKAYPAVLAKKHTWSNYCRAFAHWFHFAGLVSLEGDEILIGRDSATGTNLLSPGRPRPAKGITVFPRSQVGAVLRLLSDIARSAPIPDSSAMKRALLDSKYLQLVIEAKGGGLSLTTEGKTLASALQPERASILTKVLEGQPAFQVGKRLLQDDPGTTAIAVGQELCTTLRLQWSLQTQHWVGKSIRGWMREAGYKTALRPRRVPTQPSQISTE